MGDWQDTQSSVFLKEAMFRASIGSPMNWKRRIAKEWLWFLCSIAGGFLLWSVLGFYKPPLIETDVQPVRRTVPPSTTTDFKPVERVTEKELNIQVQRDAPIDPNLVKWDDSSSDTIEKWKELRIIFAVLLVPFLYFMRITVWSFKQIRKKPK